MPKKKTTPPAPEEQDLLEPQAILEPIPEDSVSNTVAADAPAADEAEREEVTPAAEDFSEEDSDAGRAADVDPFNPAEQSDPLDDNREADDGEPQFVDEAPASDDTPYNDLLQELGSLTAQDDAAPLVLEDGAAADKPDASDADDLLLLSEEGGAGDPASLPASEETAAAASSGARRRERILTIDARSEVQTEEEREAIVWHEIQNSHRTRRILTGTLDGVEKTESGLTIALVNYKGFRVAIPVKEMMLHTGRMPSGREFAELMERLHRILNSRLGAEIDFVVKGYDNGSRSVVASRRDAMLRKRQTFYIDTDELGEHLIYEGRVVQARVVAVAEKVIRVEVFGVEASIVARGLSWEWIGNARDHFSVGDRILVRVQHINREDLEHITIQVDARSVSATNSHDNLKKCLPQCRYVGRVTDVRNGVVFIRLNNGVNAIAHSCYDLRAPGKKDDVSFAVTRLDEEQGVAIGIITRIIKQNL